MKSRSYLGRSIAAPSVVRRLRIRARRATPGAATNVRDTEGGSRLLTCVRDAASGRDKATVNAALGLLWSSQHLENLWRLEAHLAERGNAACNCNCTRLDSTYICEDCARQVVEIFDEKDSPVGRLSPRENLPPAPHWTVRPTTGHPHAAGADD